MKPVVIRNVTIGEGMPKICVPIVGIKEKEIVETARQIKDTPADLVEWRVDWFESAFDVDKVKMVLLELRAILGDMPILFTFRTDKEGGKKSITPEGYRFLLSEVAKTKWADLIDVEAFCQGGAVELIAGIKTQGVKVVGSNHEFHHTPEKEEIIRRLRYMQDIGADIPKIAVMPQTKEDVQVLLEATKEMAEAYADRPIVTMSMGELGVVSRVSGEKFGSAITFGAFGQVSAPGQISVHELKEILEVLHRNQKQ
jgi:3-dehydroquinate dehydratase-1